MPGGRRAANATLFSLRLCGGGAVSAASDGVLCPASAADAPVGFSYSKRRRLPSVRSPRVPAPGSAP
eukprot:2551640-Pleurochrysis_carterae.AAC.1